MLPTCTKKFISVSVCKFLRCHLKFQQEVIAAALKSTFCHAWYLQVLELRVLYCMIVLSCRVVLGDCSCDTVSYHMYLFSHHNQGNDTTGTLFLEHYVLVLR